MHECSLKNCPLKGKLKVQISYDDGEIDYPILYNDGHIVYDFPERLDESIISRVIERFDFVQRQNEKFRELEYGEA